MARLGGPTLTPGANIASRGQNIFPQVFPTASVSVGKDDWANQVIDNVVGSGQEWGESREESLKKTILEKKRLFHSHRYLELKNLPDGVTEQVTLPTRVHWMVQRQQNFANRKRVKTWASRLAQQLLRDCTTCAVDETAWLVLFHKPVLLVLFAANFRRNVLGHDHHKSWIMPGWGCYDDTRSLNGEKRGEILCSRDKWTVSVFHFIKGVRISG